MVKNNPNSKKWVCLEITHRYNKSQHVKTVKKFLYNMFTPQQILFLGSQLDEQNFNNVMDGYFFIQCNNLEPYIDKLKNSKYINNVLINFQHIQYIDDSQIQAMLNNYNENYNNRQNELSYGDIVKVKKGMFKNLYAVVTELKNEHQIMAVFKFISGYRFQKLDVDNCQKQGNLFNIIKVAV